MLSALACLSFASYLSGCTAHCRLFTASAPPAFHPRQDKLCICHLPTIWALSPSRLLHCCPSLSSWLLTCQCQWHLQWCGMARLLCLIHQKSIKVAALLHLATRSVENTIFRVPHFSEDTICNWLLQDQQLFCFNTILRCAAAAHNQNCGNVAGSTSALQCQYL